MSNSRVRLSDASIAAANLLTDASQTHNGQVNPAPVKNGRDQNPRNSVLGFKA